MDRVWAGIDIGKGHHHCVVVDSEGRKRLSRRVANDEAVLLELVGEVTAMAAETVWAIDLDSSESALLVALLLSNEQTVVYLPGEAVHHASVAYRGAGKTDAKDAFVIADQARMRRDLVVVYADHELIVELRMLVAQRQDLVADRVRAVNRLHDRLLNISPALERALDLRCQGPLVLLTEFATPTAIREAGVESITAWLRRRGVRSAAPLAARVFRAAQAQMISLPGEQVAARLVVRAAEGVMDLDEQIKEIGLLIEERFRRHRSAEVILSMPGIGVLLGAEFLAATGGDMSRFRSADRLASFAGVAPVPRDSGRVSGNLHRPRRYNRGLQRVFFMSAQISTLHNAESKRYYQRKRSEGKRHTQAVLALARRRVNVLWVLLREGRRYESSPPQAHAA